MSAVFLLLKFALCAALLDNASAISLRFWRRDGTVTPTVLSTAFIPLTVNSEQRYIVGVNMSSDANTQRFKFAIAANTGYTAVAAQGCLNCDGVSGYDPSVSSTSRQLQRNASISVGSANFSGQLYSENCGMHESNGTAWQYKNQTVIVANSSSTLFTNVTSGLVGLGTLANGASGDFLDTIYGQWFGNNPTHNNFSFGMDLKPPTFTSDDDTGNGGILHWVVPDSSAYQGTVTWATASVSNSPADVSSGTTSDESGVDVNSNFTLPETDWQIELDGWAASIAGTSVENSTKVSAMIEPYFPDIFFPQSQAQLLYDAVSGSTQLSAAVGGGEAWSVPCSTSFSVAITIQGQSFPLNGASLVQQQSDGSCIGTIKGWPDPDVTNFLLGSRFISEYYIIFIIGRPGSGVSNQVGFAPKASSSSTNIGAIVGGAVGGTAAVAILIGLAFWLGRRSKRRPIHLHIGGVSNGGGMTNEKDHEKVSIFSDPQRGPASQHHSSTPAYTVSSLPNNQGHGHSQVYSQSHFTPPNSARSASSSHPLLPELQAPVSPAFPSASIAGNGMGMGEASFPNTPNTPAHSNFLSMMSSGPSGGAGSMGVGVHAFDGQSMTTASGGQVSYNRLALSNANTNTASVYTENAQYGISPYILPPSSGTPTSSKSQTQSQPNSAGMHASYDERLLPSAILPSAFDRNALSNRNSSDVLPANANSPSLRNQVHQSYNHSQDQSRGQDGMNDNATETATETGASSQSVVLGAGAAGRNGVVAEPFVLSPAPRIRVARNERKNTVGTEATSGAATAPPAYTEAANFNMDSNEASMLLPSGAGAPAVVGLGTDAMSPTLVDYRDASSEPLRSRRTTGAY